MKDIDWKKLNLFQKIIFCMGWIYAITPIFWIALLIHSAITQEDKFWNPKSFRVIYVFGWIFLIGFLLVTLLGILDILGFL